MTFVEEWQAKLDDSLAEFAKLAATTDGIDFTYGILATAVLWPVRNPVQEFDGDALDAMRNIVGVQAKHIIKAMQDWSDDHVASARSLAIQAQDNADLRSALTTLINFFDATQTFAAHLAGVLAPQQDGGDVYNITEQIKAALVNIGGVTNIETLAITISVPYAKPRPERGVRYWLAVTVAIFLVVAGVSTVVWFLLNPPLPPMGTGFNVAVAEFAVLDGITPREVGAEFSEWLFKAIVKEVDQLPAALSVDTRGPQDIGVIEGTDRETRARNAAKVADEHNATILIYGVVSKDVDDPQVQPEFFVCNEGFEYGSEVAGHELLGHPITIDMTLDPGKRFELNEKLNARSQALQHLVVGLSYFFIRHYGDAENAFQRAAGIDGWRPDEGKEVAYLLLGAAQLRAYDEIANPDPLAEAEAAFRHAYELNQNYGRSYLGLGAVALEQAKALNEDRTAIGGVDEAKLIEARDWYSDSLRTTDQPATAYIPAKAAYGLGQIHLMGFELGVSGWSGLKAERFFNQVVAAYEDEPVPELAWFAARSQAYLGRIAGHRGDYEKMSAEIRTAIDMLNELPGTCPRHLVARYWAWVALAEEQAGQLGEACDAYRQALESGRGSVSPQELAKWQDDLDYLDQGGP